MQFLLGVITALVIVAGAFLFVKHSQLSILLVSRDKGAPLFLKSKELKTGDYIEVKHQSPFGAVGTITSVDSLSVSLLSQLLVNKNKDSLRMVIKEHYPKEFIHEHLNNSLCSMLTGLIAAKNTNRPKHVDMVIDMMKAYVHDTNRFYEERVRYGLMQSNSFVANFILDDYRYKLSKFMGLLEVEELVKMVYLPWKNGKNN